jgi:mono/diheme cytochrome c family protein
MTVSTRIGLPVIALTLAWLVPNAGRLPVAAQQKTPVVDRSTTSDVSYTAEQARRGQALFRRNCQFCHSTDAANQKTDKEPLRGFSIGDKILATMPLGGRYALKYRSVYHMYVRIRDNMPAWDIQSVSPQQKVDILAFLLKENGFPARQRELTLDTDAMKTMLLAKPAAPEEPGFETLFNGKDFTNFKFLFGINCTPPPGCGRTDPNVFSVQNGVMVSSGRQSGYMYTEKRYLNFDLRFDYRIVPPPDYTADDEPLLNGGGFYFFLNDQRVWGRGIELEGDNDDILHPYAIDAMIQSTWEKSTAENANKGPGPWNSVRVVSKNGHVDAYLNNTLVAQITKHPFTEPGHIAWQYEGSTWMYRRIRIKAE